MKNLLPFLLVVTVFASCTNSAMQSGPESQRANFSDTTGLAQFQAWKAQSTTGTRPATEFSSHEKPVVEKRIVYYVPRYTAPSRHRFGYNSGTSSMVSSSSNMAIATRKRGWSTAAKASAIGVGSGAIIGAVVNKRNPLVGGIIGGLLGGGIGYGVGHSMDKRNGR